MCGEREPRKVLILGWLIAASLCGSAALAQDKPDLIAFRQCLTALWPDAAAREIPRPLFDEHTSNARPNDQVLTSLESQPEFMLGPGDYVARLVNEHRVRLGKERLSAYAALFSDLEQTYGVDRYILAAVWGVETNFGTQIGQWPVLEVTATLACRGPRQPYFREQFIAALAIIARGEIAAARLRGSWSGAFGQTQFMPTAYEQYSIDFDGDGRHDIIDSIPDSLASTANYLKNHGWWNSEIWGLEVALPAGFDYRLTDQTRTLPQWSRLGVLAGDRALLPDRPDAAWLWLPAGVGGPAFLILRNFQAILGYNPAELYALAVGLLSDRLGAGSGLVREFPKDVRLLTKAERVELQDLLVVRGFDVGGVGNGYIGRKTRAAIHEFQESAGLTPDGFASPSLLDRLRVLDDNAR
jgi:membrane-bound lytic murein transglycosylase B